MPYDPDDRRTHNLEVLSKRELIALLCLREVRFDESDLRFTCAAIMERLRVLNARAREGRDVEQASEFARWVVQAGFAKLFHGKGRGDFQALQSDTLWACECAWKKSPLGPAAADLESTREKLDKLIFALAKVSEPSRLLLENG